MRAAVFQGVGRPLTIQTVADPEPDPGKLLLVGRDGSGRFQVGDRVTALPCIACGSCASCVPCKRDFAVTIDMLARRRIDPAPLLGDTVSWDAFPAAFEALPTDRSRIKGMLEPR